uniref:Uncharacterized protein n=1 Tax=Ditylenchus dipsaci TaxID=166011 RepID=A0A915ERP1_9BILA
MISSSACNYEIVERHEIENEDCLRSQKSDTDSKRLTISAEERLMVTLSSKRKIQIGARNSFIIIFKRAHKFGALTLEEIVEDSKEQDSKQPGTESMELDEEEVHPEEPIISSLETARAMDIVRRFTEKNSGDPNILKYSDALDEFIYQHRAKNQKQKKLTDFFSSIINR